MCIRDRLHTVTMFAKHAAMFLIDMWKAILTPIYNLGVAIGNVLEGPFFKLMMFMKHFGLFLKWTFIEAGKVIWDVMGGAVLKVWEFVKSLPSKFMGVMK